MIASGFAAGTGGGKSVEEYLTKEEGRDVAPEIFKGDFSITRDLIDSSHRRWTYTHGVLAFHQDDSPTQSQLEEIVQDFEDFMFAGKAPDTFNIVWVLHQDKGNTELHFVVPRVDLETGQDLNIAAPGYEKDWAAWVASINHRYGFTDPFEQSPILTKGVYREPLDRKATRAEINSWIEEQVAEGLIESRDHLIETLGKIGDVTRVNDKFISLKTDADEKAFRLKGAIYETGFDFKAGRSRDRALESERREAGKGAGYSAGRVSGGDAGKHRATDRGRSAEIDRNRAAAFERRRDFFEKLRARSRKLQAERKADELRNREAEREGPQTERGVGSGRRETHSASEPQDADWLVDGGGNSPRGHSDSPGGFVEGPQSHGEGRGGPESGRDPHGLPEGLPEPLRARSGADRGGKADVHPARGASDDKSLWAGNPAQSYQRLDRGELTDADSGPFTEALERLGERERRLAEVTRSTERALRSHGRFLERVVQIAGSAKRAAEHIAEGLRQLVEKIARRKSQEPRPNSGWSGPSLS